MSCRGGRAMTAAFTLSLAFLLSAAAAAEDIQKTYNGKIIIAKEAFPSKMDEELSAFLKTNAKKDGRYTLASDGLTPWTFNIMAFLSKDPGGADLNLVFYDKDDKEAQKKFEPIQSIQIGTTKGGRVIKLSEISLTTDLGFAGGKTYLVRATQLKGGKEVVLAETQLTLSVTAPK
jgi:hypothetical protein